MTVSLIVSEGSKTEALYFGEIRQQFKLQTANVQVQPSGFGTQRHTTRRAT
jgi:hypothetical protein